MEPLDTRGMMTAASMAFATCLALVGIVSWAKLGPWWGVSMAFVIAALAAAAALAMWRLPGRWRVVTRVLSVVAVVVVAMSIPATIRGLVALGDGVLEGPNVVLTLVLLGTFATIYLAFAGASLLTESQGDSEVIRLAPARRRRPGFAVATG